MVAYNKKSPTELVFKPLLLSINKRLIIETFENKSIT